MLARLSGGLLFVPVPLVLVLITRFPFGVGASLGLGAALIVSHRFYARPFALARAGTRCLWCAGPSGGGPQLVLREPFGVTTWRACSPAHAERLRRTFGWAARRARFLRAGILGGLALLAVGAAAAVRGMTGALVPEDWAQAFRVTIALTVLPLGWLGPRGAPADDAASTLPFPVHIQALIGTAAVLWLFRLVGAAWLALGVVHFAGRLG